MENENLRNIENLLAAKASTQPLYEFPVDQLPLGLRDSLSGVAAEARVPALFSALPIAATYADRLKAKYCDGSDTPMALMSIIIGEQASGKGVCRRIENIWAKKMDKDDEKPREDEAWYQQHKGKKGVVDPKPCIRHIGDTISKSALMRRQLCARSCTASRTSKDCPRQTFSVFTNTTLSTLARSAASLAHWPVPDSASDKKMPSTSSPAAAASRYSRSNCSGLGWLVVGSLRQAARWV